MHTLVQLGAHKQCADGGSLMVGARASAGRVSRRVSRSAVPWPKEKCGLQDVCGAAWKVASVQIHGGSEFEVSGLSAVHSALLQVQKQACQLQLPS